MNYYEILEIRNDASEETIRAAYKALAKKYHPDNYLDGGIMMKKINEAYSVLTDKKLRQAYDSDLQKEENNHKKADGKRVQDYASTKEETEQNSTSGTNEEIPLTFTNTIIGVIGLIFEGCVYVIEFVCGIILLLLGIGFFTGHTQTLVVNILDRVVSF